MLLSLAWRNIWRNKRRCAIIISAIAAGILCGLFAAATMFGMGESFVNSTIDRNLGHIQVHSAKYEDEKLLTDTIPYPKRITERIISKENTAGITSRIILEGMGSSATTSTGLKIFGIDPQKEKTVTKIHEKIIAGDYLGNIKNDSQRRVNPIIIGEKLADNLGVKERSKIVLSFQGFDGSIIYGAFRIVGIFRTESTAFDRSHVFVPEDVLFDLLDSRPVYHEIAVRLSSVQYVDSVCSDLKKDFKDVSVKSWRELSPDMKLMDEMIVMQLNIFLGVILFALLFGITNTMLMSVMERVREFGVLMAIGMKRRRIFSMIIIETISLSLAGGIMGMLIASIVIAYFGQAGIDLSAFAKGMAAWNMNPVLQPTLPLIFYLSITIMVIVTAVLSALYPALKAIKLKPADAIRTY